MERLAEEWSDAALRDVDPDVFRHFPGSVRDRGSLLRPGADPGAVSAFESRLGMRLPPSYREFLLYTDGAYGDLLGVRSVRWGDESTLEGQGIGFLPVSALSPRTEPTPFFDEGDVRLDGSILMSYRAPMSEWQYLDHAHPQDSVRFKDGHCRHVLTISSNIDGYQVLLNPLVRQPDGEWEAWDLGAKYPGVNRFRSFRDLLEYAAGQERWYQRYYRPGDNNDSHYRAGLRTVMDRSLDLETRQSSVGSLDLFYPEQEDALRQLAALPDAGQLHLVRYLVASEAQDLQQRGLELLIGLGPESTSVGYIPADPGGVIVESFRRTGNIEVLVAGAASTNPEIKREVARQLNNPGLDAAKRKRLARQLYRPPTDSLDDLKQAATLPDAPLPEIAGQIASIDPEDASLLQALLDNPEANWHMTCTLLRTSGSTEARDIVIERLRQGIDEGRNAQFLASTLGNYRDPTAVRAAVSLLDRDQMLLSTIFILEDQSVPEARDALAAIQHIQADRALARMGDQRCLDRLVQSVQSPDPEQHREALEGLRELANPDTAEVLAEAMQTHPPESDEAAICAHTLVLINDADSSLDMINRLQESSDNSHLHAVTTSWAAQLRP